MRPRAILFLLPALLLATGESLTADEPPGAGEWESLFDGKSSAGWSGKDGAQFPSDYWVVEDSCLRTVPARAGRDLFTARTFRNFELSLEWKVSPAGNSGVFYNLYDQPMSPRMLEWYSRPLRRAVLEYLGAMTALVVGLFLARRSPAARRLVVVLMLAVTGVAVYAATQFWQVWRSIQATAVGLEMQVLDDERHPDGARGPLYRAGALYDLVPAAPGAVRPAGEWNQARVLVQGPHVEHWLNGVKVVEYELGSPDLMARVANSKYREVPGYGTKRESAIALQHHHDAVWFRNIRIRSLASRPVESSSR